MSREYLHYFNRKYIEDVVDCWTLMQDIYRDLHSIDLPNQPQSYDSEVDKSKILHRNCNLAFVDGAEKGIMIHFDDEKQHCGYCISENHYIHATRNGVKIDKVPTSYSSLKNIHFYKVLKNEV